MKPEAEYLPEYLPASENYLGLFGVQSKGKEWPEFFPKLLAEAY